jgi:S1-C subfamily serine protease
MVHTPSLSALEKQKPFQSLVPDTAVEGILDISDKGTGYETFRFTVPEKVFGVELKLFNAPADLDLFVQYGSEIRSYEHTDFSSVTDNYGETLFFSRLTDPSLKSGTYYVDVAYQRTGRPRIDGKRSEAIPFSLSLTFIDGSRIERLLPGIPGEGVLRPEEGMTARFYVDVPDSAQALRIDIVDTDADIDFMLARENPIADREAADFIRESFLGRESVTVSAASDPPLSPGRYYVTLFDQVSTDHPERFSIMASLSGEVPQILGQVPPLPLPSDEVESVLLSTVEVVAAAGKGSGSIVSRDGLILTNWHVIENYDQKASPDIFIAVNLDDRYPPRELFRAELIDSDPEGDLALLKITGLLSGSPLPPGYRFPYIGIGDSERLRIGQPLSFFGYPGIGGTGSRASISITRGIVSGFEAVGERLYIKTDAEINSGNSGGAAVDAYYQLLGIPTVIIGEEGGQIAFVTPVSALPEEWLKTILLHNL